VIPIRELLGRKVWTLRLRFKEPGGLYEKAFAGISGFARIFGSGVCDWRQGQPSISKSLEVSMKLRFMKTGAATIVALFALGFAGCNVEPEELSSDANLSAITVAGVRATLGTPSADWNSTSPGIVALTPDKLAGARVDVTKAKDGSKVYYFAGKPEEIVVPDFVETSTFTFLYGDSLYVEVFSENHDAVLIYQIAVISTAPIVSDITLGGRSATGGTLASGLPIPKYGTGVGNPGKTWNDAAIQEGSVFFGASQSETDLPLVITAENPATPLSSAISDGNTEPIFASVSGTLTITATNGKYLYIKADSLEQGSTESGYYKIKLVQKNDNRALTSVKIGTQTMSLGAMGTHSYPGSEAYGNYSNGAELAATGGIWNWSDFSGLNNIAVDIVPTDSALSVKFGQGINARDYAINFQALPANKQVNLKVGAWIGIEVASEIGEKGWYKFQVEDKSVVTAIGIGSNSAAPGKMTVQPGTFGTTVTGSPSQLGVSGTLAGANLVTVTAAGLTNPKFEARIGAISAMPAAWNAVVVPGDIDTSVQSVSDVADGNVVWIRLTADNLGPVHYYAVSVLDSSIPPSMTALNIGGANVTIADLGTANANVASATAGSFTLAGVVSDNALINPTLGNGTSFRVALTTTDSAPADNSADWKS
jgi:hypothetical protein